MNSADSHSRPFPRHPLPSRPHAGNRPGPGPQASSVMMQAACQAFSGSSCDRLELCCGPCFIYDPPPPPQKIHQGTLMEVKLEARAGLELGNALCPSFQDISGCRGDRLGSGPAVVASVLPCAKHGCFKTCIVCSRPFESHSLSPTIL